MDEKGKNYSFLEDCPKCNHYDKSNGLCKKFHYNVSLHQEKLFKNCNGKYHTGKTTHGKRKKLLIYFIFFVICVAFGVQFFNNWDSPTLGGILLIIGFIMGFRTVNLLIKVLTD
jgi:hypothetical protein